MSKTNKPGLVKMEFNTIDDKVAVLRAKQNLSVKGGKYERVYIRSSQTHEERLMRLNFDTLLKEIPAMKDTHRITGNGRLVKLDGNDNRNKQRTEGPRGAAGRGRDPVPPVRKSRLSHGSTDDTAHR